MAVFALASLACGLAPSTGALVAARAAQGLGAALLLPGTLAIISRAFPERGVQARAIGIWAGVGAVALPAGPLLGGLLVQGLGWRWVFDLNVPIVLVAGLVAARVVRADAEPGTGRLGRRRCGRRGPRVGRVPARRAPCRESDAAAGPVP